MSTFTIVEALDVLEHLLPHYADIESVHQTDARPLSGHSMRNKHQGAAVMLRARRLDRRMEFSILDAQ